MLADKQSEIIGNRDFGADVVRIAALFMVLGLHFFLRNGFYYTEIKDAFGFIALTLRSILLCCVPLFMMLTGYLKCDRKWDAGYYRSLLPILFSYLIISLIHLPYKIFIREQEAKAGEWVLRFFRFELAEYGWYVSMYIGLFLLSPLLNMIWTSVKSRRAHQAVVLTFVALTFFPATVNKTSLGNLAPNYFQSIYYVTYYMLGCYIRTYKPKPNRWVCGLFVLGIGAFLAWLNITTRTEAGDFYSGYRAGYNGLAEGYMVTAMFLLLYRCKRSRAAVQRLAAHISGVVFEVYLLSYIADSKIYVLFYKQYPMSLYIPVGIAMVLSVFILSYPAALCVNRFVRKIICGRFISVRSRMKLNL